MGNSQTLSCASGEKSSKGQKKEEMYTKTAEKTNGVSGNEDDEAVVASSDAQESGTEKSAEVPAQDEQTKERDSPAAEPEVVEKKKEELEADIPQADESSPDVAPTEAEAPASTGDQAVTVESNTGTVEEKDDSSVEKPEEDKSEAKADVAPVVEAGESKEETNPTVVVQPEAED